VVVRSRSVDGHGAVLSGAREYVKQMSCPIGEHHATDLDETLPGVPVAGDG
jgi:hypothetical protein